MFAALVESNENRSTAAKLITAPTPSTSWLSKLGFGNCQNMFRSAAAQISVSASLLETLGEQHGALVVTSGCLMLISRILAWLQIFGSFKALRFKTLI